MKTYARIEDKRVAEIVSMSVKPEKLYHPSLEWVDITALSEQPSCNYLYSDGVFTAPFVDAKDAGFLASSRLSAEMDEANRTITPLQDAVDISIATDEELTRLAAWKRYRVMLSRTDITTAPDISWPDKPE
ncbi:Tail fiber assembly protein [Pantoea agglomerans 299R]|nr:tail fiber assembly protein [Pantoea agglomerans]ELP23337.1 Tail fiber assembly protein [Pantoea agglomerans 299R]